MKQWRLKWGIIQVYSPKRPYQISHGTYKDFYIQLNTAFRGYSYPDEFGFGVEILSFGFGISINKTK